MYAWHLKGKRWAEKHQSNTRFFFFKKHVNKKHEAQIPKILRNK